MQGASRIVQLHSPKLIQFCKQAFKQHPRYKSWFYFSGTQVKLVLDDLGESDQFPTGEVHIAKFEVATKARGQGLGSLAMQALVTGADIYSVHLTLYPAAFSEDDNALTQRQLESFYRRYGFRGERGLCRKTPGEGRQVMSMIRKPEAIKL